LRPPLEFLRSVRNPDGGWGYFPGKESWLEPTAYAALALHGDPVAERALGLIRSWQLPNGAFRPAAHVQEESWAAALALTLHQARGLRDVQFQRGAAWLTRTIGTEDSLASWWMRLLGLTPEGQDWKLRGWPWRPGASSWVEPTAHSLVALRWLPPSGPVTARIDLAEKMLRDRRCRDGGWNYGNRSVMGTDLESYPESTAIALVGLSGSRGVDLKPSLDRAREYWRGRVSPLARAWLAIALRLHGASFEEPATSPHPTPDVALAALEAIGRPDGAWRLLRREAA